MLRSTTTSTINHFSSLADANVPNYRIAGTATVGFLLLSFMSALNDCGSATAYFSLGCAVANGVMFANQNWDSTCEYTAWGVDVVKTEAGNLLNKAKENEWLNDKYKIANNKWNSFFGTKPTDHRSPHVVTSEEDQIKIKKNK